MDVPALLVLLQHVHETEGYPVRDEAVSPWWLTAAEKPGQPSRPELGGWVALDGERVVGHVALHPAAGPCLPLWLAGTGRGEEGIAVVSRLFTDRSIRGTGTALLQHAVRQARAHARSPVLEVDGVASPAYHWYLRRGWRELGRVTQQWGHRTVDTAALEAPA